MKSIDIHAHSTPQCFQRDVLKGKKWHNMTSEEGELNNPRNAWSPEERIADQDADGVDAEILYPNKGLVMWATPDPRISQAM